mmetsp:Transcript_21297/g.44753  ORF Transcript_21297/g.44753 Transcript_21297/m.44753 type:complete len:159 (-) Transcript_21297:89-565(-)
MVIEARDAFVAEFAVHGEVVYFYGAYPTEFCSLIFFIFTVVVGVVVICIVVFPPLQMTPQPLVHRIGNAALVSVIRSEKSTEEYEERAGNGGRDGKEGRDEESELEKEQGEEEPCSYLHGVERFLEAVSSHGWFVFIFDIYNRKWMIWLFVGNQVWGS